MNTPAEHQRKNMKFFKRKDNWPHNLHMRKEYNKKYKCYCYKITRVINTPLWKTTLYPFVTKPIGKNV